MKATTALQNHVTMVESLQKKPATPPGSTCASTLVESYYQYILPHRAEKPERNVATHHPVACLGFWASFNWCIGFL